MYLTAAMTGLRQGELLALRWRDVDCPARKIRVSGGMRNGQRRTPKSPTSSRAVAMADRVGGALDWLFKASAYRGDDDLVFGHPHTGRPLDRSHVSKRFKRSLQRAGVREDRFHDLRHTFGTRMAAAGVPIRTLQAWMGHSDIRRRWFTPTTRPPPTRSTWSTTRSTLESWLRGLTRGLNRAKLSPTRTPETPVNPGVHARVLPHDPFWGPGGRRFRSCLPDY